MEPFFGNTINKITFHPLSCSEPTDTISSTNELKTDHIFIMVDTQSTYQLTVFVCHSHGSILCYIFFTTRRGSHLGYGEINISISTDMVVRPHRTIPWFSTSTILPLMHRITGGQCVFWSGLLYMVAATGLPLIWNIYINFSHHQAWDYVEFK